MSFPRFSARDAVARHGDAWQDGLHDEVTAVAGEFPFDLPFAEDMPPAMSDYWTMWSLTHMCLYRDELGDGHAFVNELRATTAFTAEMRLDW